MHLQVGHDETSGPVKPGRGKQGFPAPARRPGSTRGPASRPGQPFISPLPLVRPVPTLADLASFVKVEHSLLTLPFVYAGTVLAAGGLPAWPVLVLVTTAGVGARTCAMSLNRIIDAGIDARNPRTADRELPAGRLRHAHAAAVTLAGAALLVASAALLNPLVLLLSPVLPALYVAYPYTKRWTSASHLFLGFTLGIAPIGGWLAVTGTFAGFLPSFVLGMGVMLWAAGYDVIYALLDVDFDRDEGLHSLPARWGRGPALWAARGLQAGGFALFFALPFLMPLGWPWLAALVPVAGLIAAQHVWARREDPRSIDRAFFWANAVVAVTLMVAAGLAVGVS